MKHLFVRLKEQLIRLFAGKKKTVPDGIRDGKENPYLSQSREIIIQILAQRGLDYGRFRPLLLDTDCPDQHFGEKDDVDQLLDQLEPGLNFLEICTDRPQYFEAWSDDMLRENGLIVRILPERGWEKTQANMVLDLERFRPLWIEQFAKDILYLPFYKRKWVPAAEKSPVGGPKENLDIKVPIGYNMVIVGAGINGFGKSKPLHNVRQDRR